jgi:RNA polymerase sigma-70 factor (ECF subfamily)
VTIAAVGDGAPAMSDTNRTALLALLVTSYDDLKQRLTRRTGSADLADEALQDTFLRLSKADGIGPVRDLPAYLFRVAMSAISNRRVAERRRRTVPQADTVFDLPDETPGPDRIIEARSEISALRRAIQELPARRREIFMAICVEEIPLQQVAKRFGISVRTVQVEIKQALVHCAVCIDRNAQMPRVGFRRRNPFSERDRAALHPASESDTLLGRRLPLGGSR